MVICGIWDKKTLATFGHLPEYPTCSKAMSWCDALCTMNFTGSIKPSFQYGSMPCKGFWLFAIYPGCLMMMHPLSSDGIAIQGRIIPKFYFGFPGTFHRTVFLYYGRQVSEACNITTTYSVKDSLIRAITAEN